MNVDHLPGDLTGPSFGRLACTKCGTIVADGHATRGTAGRMVAGVGQILDRLGMRSAHGARAERRRCGGVAAGRLVAEMGSKGAEARALAYRLFEIATQKGWAAEELVLAYWSAVMVAEEVGRILSSSEPHRGSGRASDNFDQ